MSSSIGLSARRRPMPRSPEQTGEPRAPPPPGHERRVFRRRSPPGSLSAELAVLSVIGRQCQRAGVCALPIDAIAALAGVSRTSVQNAMRQARRLGLIEVRERRRRGLPSLTNVVKVISREWQGWLKLNGGGGGFKKPSPTFSSFYPIEKNGKNGDKAADPHVMHWRNKAIHVNMLI